MSDVDVIVLDIDGGEMLRACVDSIRAQTVTPRSIVIFDNGSRMPVSECGLQPALGWAEDRPHIRVIRSETNLGFAAGVNEAYRATSAAYVALINNDVVLDRDWLATLEGTLDGDEKIAAAQTIIRRGDGAIDGAGIDVSDGTIRQLGYGQPLGSSLPQAWGVSATAAMYRRSALGQRMFDPRFFAYYEDVELAARLRESGWRMVVVPQAKATHRGSASASVLGRDALRLRTRNRYFVARMHRGVVSMRALLFEDLRLLVRGRSSVSGIIEGLCSRL